MLVAVPRVRGRCGLGQSALRCYAVYGPRVVLNSQQPRTAKAAGELGPGCTSSQRCELVPWLWPSRVFGAAAD